jgi:glycine oxidase
VLGAGSIGGLLWASGHHRNGVLLAPLTAELLANELAHGDGGVAGERGRIALQRAELLAACSPSRFAPSEPRPSEARAGAELVS